MTKVKLLSLVLSVILCLVHANNWDIRDVHMRHDYHYAFKKPFFYPNNSQTIPYFDTISNAIKTKDYIRLAPSVPNVFGGIWSQRPANFKDWEVEFSFASYGRGYMGGKGMAFWYTKDRMTDGPVFGSKDNFIGLGIFFDTSDQQAGRYTPLISGIVNDGTMTVSTLQGTDHTLGTCFRDYRNSVGPVWVRIIYHKGTLSVELDVRQEGYAYTSCFSKANVFLPEGYYFGLSAATSNLADDHDIYSFETYQYNPPPRPNAKKRPHEDEHKQKGDGFEFTDEMKEKIKKVETKVKQFEEENRQKEPDGYQEAINSHTIHSLQENQFKIIEALNLIHQKIDLPNVAHSDGTSSGGIPADTAKSHEVDDVRRQLSDLTKNVQELTDIVHEAFGKMIKSDTSEGSSLHQYVENHMVMLHNKLEDSKAEIKKTHDKIEASSTQTSSGTHYAMYMVFLLLGIIIMQALRVMMKSDKPKKYI